MKTKFEFLSGEYKFEVLRPAPDNTNSILISWKNECVIFDAWGRADEWEKHLSARGLKLHAIYTTHGHFDHIGAAPILAARFNIPWYLNHNDMMLMSMLNPMLEYFKLSPVPDDCVPPIDLPAGEFEILPGLWTNVILTPGHSAGGVAFHFAKQGVLIIGDTIFQDSVGRYDLPGANKSELFDSIARIYNMNLPDDTVVIHGHGMDTTIGYLKRNNRYFTA